MEIIKRTAAGADFEFICAYRNTRSGFAHDCELWSGNRMLTSATAHYLNRTWESWRYQTVCLQCVYNLREQARENIREEYKRRNGYTRITAKRREELEQLYKDAEGLKVLEELENVLRGSRYGSEEERERLESLEALNTLLEILFHGERESTSPAA